MQDLKIYHLPLLPLEFKFEKTHIYKQLNIASRALAELKGVAKTIPNESILLNTLVLQEAKESSEIENIVTTQDEIYKADLNMEDIKTSQKEVLRYRQAMQKGFSLIRTKKLLTNLVIKEIQSVLEENCAGFRVLPGTTLKNHATNETVYTPPQTKDEIENAMSNLEMFINDNSICELDPLIKLAIIHHQFESIHPFYDGNGRTGRIVNVLYLVMNDLLELPILYISRYINHKKTKYYELIQNIRDSAPKNETAWEEWVMFILEGIEQTANQTVALVSKIKNLMQEFKPKLRELFGTKYNHEILNNLFNHPYTKVEYLSRDLSVSRQTATKYLEDIVKCGFLEKVKMGRSNYYINWRLVKLFVEQ